MLSYPSTISLSSRTLNHLADRIRGHRQQRKLRCCPRRATAIVQAILVLHHVEANRYTG